MPVAITLNNHQAAVLLRGIKIAYKRVPFIDQPELVDVVQLITNLGRESCQQLMEQSADRKGKQL